MVLINNRPRGGEEVIKLGGINREKNNNQAGKAKRKEKKLP